MLDARGQARRAQRAMRCPAPAQRLQPPGAARGASGGLGAQVAYGVGADEQGAVRLACPAVDGGTLYPEEARAGGRLSWLALMWSHESGLNAGALVAWTACRRMMAVRRRRAGVRRRARPSWLPGCAGIRICAGRAPGGRRELHGRGRPQGGHLCEPRMPVSRISLASWASACGRTRPSCPAGRPPSAPG